MDGCMVVGVPRGTASPERALIEAQIRQIVNEPARLYDLLHALVEECYRRGALDWQRPEWQRIARLITCAELTAEALKLAR